MMKPEYNTDDLFLNANFHRLPYTSKTCHLSPKLHLQYGPDVSRDILLLSLILQLDGKNIRKGHQERQQERDGFEK